MSLHMAGIARFGQVQLDIARYGKIWLCCQMWPDISRLSQILCQICQEMIRYGHVWPHMAGMSRFGQRQLDMARYNNIWHDMAGYGQVWPHMAGIAKYSQKLQDVVRYGKIQPDVATYGKHGQIQPNIARYRKMQQHLGIAVTLLWNCCRNCCGIAVGLPWGCCQNGFLGNAFSTIFRISRIAFLYCGGLLSLLHQCLVSFAF